MQDDPKEREAADEAWLGGLLELVGAGKDIWADEDPDEYVRRLRENWE